MTYAFPHNTVVVDKDGGIVEHHMGMTLRDFFAAKAMQAFISSWVARDIYPPSDLIVAEHAYMTADAMLKAREA
jgi:hypothetical protein